MSSPLAASIWYPQMTGTLSVIVRVWWKWWLPRLPVPPSPTSLPPLERSSYAKGCALRVLAKKEATKQTNRNVFIKIHVAAKLQGLLSVSVSNRVLCRGNTWVGLRTNSCRSAVSMNSFLESRFQMGINVFWSIMIVFNCDGNELPNASTTQAHTKQSRARDVSFSPAQLSWERRGGHRVKIGKLLFYPSYILWCGAVLKQLSDSFPKYNFILFLKRNLLWPSGPRLVGPNFLTVWEIVSFKIWLGAAARGKLNCIERFGDTTSK